MEEKVKETFHIFYVNQHRIEEYVLSCGFTLLFDDYRNHDDEDLIPWQRDVEFTE